MARSRSKGQLAGFLVLGLVAAFVVFAETVGSLARKMGPLVFFFAVIGLVAIVVVTRAAAIRHRRTTLLQKYGDPQVVDRIMLQMFWQGQTAEQLRDSLGRPESVDRQALKTKMKETWKYARSGRGRYGIRIILENDVVVAWSKKSP